MGQKSTRATDEAVLAHQASLDAQAHRGPITAVAAPSRRQEEDPFPEELKQLKRVEPLDVSSVDPRWRELFARSQPQAVAALDSSGLEAILATIQSYLMRSSAATVGTQESISKAILSADALAGVLAKRFMASSRRMMKAANSLRVVRSLTLDVVRTRALALKCTDILGRAAALLPPEVVAEAEAAAAEAMQKHRAAVASR